MKQPPDPLVPAAKSLAAHLSTLRATPAALQGVVRGFETLWRWSPAPGKWTALQILGHMRDMEVEAYLPRYQRMLREDRPLLPNFDGDRLAFERAYEREAPEAVFAAWRRARVEVLGLLGSVEEADFERVGVHETDGPFTIAGLVRRHAVGNDEAHLTQLISIPRRWGLLTALGRAPFGVARAVRAALDEPADSRASEDHVVAILCALRDRERLVNERLARIAFHDRPSLWEFSGDAAPTASSAEDAGAWAAVAAFESQRTATLTLLRALPDPFWNRVGLLPSRGEVTLRTLAEELSASDGQLIERLAGSAKACEAPGPRKILAAGDVTGNVR